MEHTALNMSTFEHDLREQYKLETSRTVKIVMLTYRCIAFLCVVGLTQVIFAIITSVVRDKELTSAIKLVAESENP
jgi:hypothetical protein